EQVDHGDQPQQHSGGRRLAPTGHRVFSESPHRPGRGSDSVRIRVGDQSQVAGLLDGSGQLALITCLGAGNAAGHDFPGFGNVGFQGFEILVVDMLDPFRGKAAVFAATEEARHGQSPLRGSVMETYSLSAADSASAVSLVSSLFSSS